MELNEIIANNLIAYRKQMQLTQAELAEKINYSDKSISKWERGESVPDVAILKQLADFYGVTINDFLSEDNRPKPQKQQKEFRRKKTMIVSLSVGLVWLVATLAFIALNMFPNALTSCSWLAFIYAIPISAIITTIFSGIWKFKLFNFISISLIFWTTTLSLFLTIPIINSWLLFLIPAILQILLICWFYLKNGILKQLQKIKTTFIKKDEKDKNINEK